MEGESPQAAERYAREHDLDDIRAEMGEIRDGIGEPIDVGIVETLVGLRANGIATTQSCEGHDDRALALPWVDINAPEPDDLDDEAAVAAWTVANEELAEDTRKLLAEWEGTRLQAGGVPPLPGQQLILRAMGIFGAVRLQPEAQDRMSAMSQNDRQGNTAMYRQRMSEFGEFLKQRYLEGVEQ